MYNQILIYNNYFSHNCINKNFHFLQTKKEKVQPNSKTSFSIAYFLLLSCSRDGLMHHNVYHKPSQMSKKSHLTNINFMGVFTCCGTVGGEDGSSVAVWVLIDDFDGFIQAVRLQNHQYRSKYLLLIALHVRLKMR